MPTQGTWQSVGYDLYSVENTSILPNTQKLIPTGIACNLPRKMFGLIKDRSLIITKRELKTQAGVINENYTGQLFVTLRTIGTEERQISIGDRIAQIILLHYKLVKWIETDNIAQTKRGEKCFGSTGTKRLRWSLIEEAYSRQLKKRPILIWLRFALRTRGKES